ncbi:MAG TPA: DinB family protein [Flavitalea sp.]|nr:DinB family protein [Flavitalea sp.]
MIDTAIKRLEYLCDVIPQLLAAIDEQAFSLKSNPGKWSKKEIIGHLIDSATNNHQRFVRGQFENRPAIIYDQDKWNEFGFYQQINGQQIISFWAAYNRQLIELIKHIPKENLQLECLVGDKLLTLNFLINDYVEHLEHHLRQVISY